MLTSYNMLNARENILTSGIQQTNRYRVFMSMGPQATLFLYPFEIIMPGYGYETLEHALWSTSRKVPYRKSYTELQLKFIIGNRNYADYIEFFNGLMPNPIQSTTPKGNDLLEKLLNATADVTEFEDDGGGGLIEKVVSGINVNARNPNAVIGEARGGCPLYMNSIYPFFVQVDLLDEYTTFSPRTSIIFDETQVSQIQPTQLTSVETGFSTFTVNIRFARMRALSKSGSSGIPLFRDIPNISRTSDTGLA